MLILKGLQGQSSMFDFLMRFHHSCFNVFHSYSVYTSYIVQVNVTWSYRVNQAKLILNKRNQIEKSFCGYLLKGFEFFLSLS